MKEEINKIGCILSAATIILSMVPLAVALPQPVTVQGTVTYADGSYVPNGWLVVLWNLDEDQSAQGEPWNTTTGALSGGWNYTVVGKSEATLSNFHINVSDPTGVYYGENASFQGKTFCINYTNLTVSKRMFDMSAIGTYPSIRGTHYGNFTPNQAMTVHRMCTYPCFKTDGHSEFVAFYNSTTGEEIANATWIRTYLGDYQWIDFGVDAPSLEANTIYNYKIITGCYPQIYHGDSFANVNGTITCTNFTDANGKIHYDWIPVIKLE